jgi:hypothetical protein
MSSAIYIHFEDGEEVRGDDWAAFCAEHLITYSPRTAGQNMYYAGDVQIEFGLYGSLPQFADGTPDFSRAEPPDSAPWLTFSTYHMGPAMAEVAALARAFWLRFGGTVSASPELRSMFLGVEART